MSVLRGFARVLGGALDGALASWHPSEAVDRAHAVNAAADALNEYEANNDGLEPAECEVCATERAQHPTLISIACGTPGCLNFSEPSAPGLTGLVERAAPEGGKLPPTGSSSGDPTSGQGGGNDQQEGAEPSSGTNAQAPAGDQNQSSATLGGGTASVVESVSPHDTRGPGARGAGQPPLDYSDAHLMRIGKMLAAKAAKTCHPKDLWYWDALVSVFGDRAAQFDALDADEHTK